MKKIKNNFVLRSFIIAFGFMVPAFALAAGPLPVNLSSAGNFAILSKSGVSTTGATSVVGDIGLSPAAATYLTGFALTLPSTSAFSTSALVTGKVYAPGYADPTAANLTAAVGDMQNAYTDAMGRTNPTATELGAGNIGGLTLAPGLYKWGTNVTIPADVTLSGGANDVWIFQIAQNLTTSSATHVILSGGAQASNVYWAVAGQTTLGTTSAFSGNILDQTSIVLNTGATLNGRALAQSAVTLDSNAVTFPSGGVSSSSSSTSTSSGQNNSNGTNTAGAAGSYGSSITNNTNTIVNNTPTTSAVVTAQSNGCMPGDLFSGTTGESCTNNSVGLPVMTNSTYNFGSVTLKNGSTGTAVMELQKFLNANLNLGLVVDGKLGPKTIAVIKTWQKNHGLVVDGLVGMKTKAMINASAQ